MPGSASPSSDAILTPPLSRLLKFCAFSFSAFERQSDDTEMLEIAQLSENFESFEKGRRPDRLNEILASRTFTPEEHIKHIDSMCSIIFVHGLDGGVMDPVRRFVKSWLRGLDSPPAIAEATIHTFGFKITDLLVKGRERLLELSECLRADVGKLNSQNLIFFGHGIAGWVIIAALASHPGLQISPRTRGVIFLGLPRFQDDGTHWRELAKSFAGPFSKNVDVLTGLEFPVLQFFETEFLKTTEYDELVVEYISLPEQASAAPILGTDSSTETTSGSREIDTTKMYLPIIVKGNSIDIAIRNFLESKFVARRDFEHLPVAGLTNTAFEKPANLSTPPLSPLLRTSPAQQTDIRTPDSVWVSRKSQMYLEPESYAAEQLKIEQTAGNSAYPSLFSSELANSSIATKDFGGKQIKRSLSNEPTILRDKRLVGELTELSDLASSYYQKGQLKQARRIYEDVIAEVKAFKEWNSSALITSAEFEIAVITLQQGYYSDAARELKLLEGRARDDFANEENFDKPWTIRRWLAVALDRQGKYSQAAQILEKMLGEIEETKADFYEPIRLRCDIAASQTQNALALVHAHLGNYEKAISLSESAIQGLNLLVHSDQHKTSQQKRDSLLRRLSRFKATMASILALTGDYEEAYIVNREAAETLEQYLGFRCVATLECWSLEAQLLAAQGKIDEAESKCDKTLDWMRAALGKDHPSTLRTLGVLASVYTSQARLTEARNTAKFLVDENGKILGDLHPQTIWVMNLLSKIYVTRGELSNALALQNETVNRAVNSLGAKHPSTLHYYSDLAMMHCNLEDWATAESISEWVFLQQASTFLRRFSNSRELRSSIDALPESPTPGKFLGNNTLSHILQLVQSQDSGVSRLDPRMLSTMHCIGIIEREKEPHNLDLALSFHANTTRFRKKKLGKDHPESLVSQLQLAITQQRCGDSGAARKNVEEVVQSRNMHLGEDHPDSISARHELSIIKSHLGKLKEAAEDQADILRLRLLLLGESHPDTRESRRLLPVMLESLHFQALAYHLQLSKTLPDKCFILLPKQKAKLEEAVIQKLSNDAIQKGERSNHGEFPGLDLSLHAGAIVSIEGLVSLYVDQKSFVEAIELQAVLNYHRELDLGYDNAATLEGMRKLASIYRLQATALLSELAIAEQSNGQDLSTILSKYYATQADLSFMYSGAGDLETAYAIQMDVTTMIQKYTERGELRTIALAVESMVDLAHTTKIMGKMNAAVALLTDAKEFNKKR
ncbi:uncharacterized protein PAC_09305 [Phialocephala subalpina]|uniref:Kinesin light chain n=1 Tax=Phialocephala subalpina TaxID=576137 RepID=A0A1L7X321_9HELO|nr:uncharacterized protein PAC_09305 [Phialocephala subalpina]